MISVLFQGKSFNITVIQVYAPISNTEEAEVERFYEDLQDLLELTPKKDVHFITGDWNAKLGREIQYEYFADAYINAREDSTHGHHQMVNTKIRLIMFFAAKDGEALYSQQKSVKCSTWIQSHK